MAAIDLPVLIVGDVHGDIERLFAALEPYPAEEWRTIFVGDLVDNGLFGVGALRFARDRANSLVLLGNHEVAMLWALRDPSRIGFWLSIGGQAHDLEELRKDDALQAWLHARPSMVRLADGTLVQHCGHDGYLRWFAPRNGGDPVALVNRRVHELLIDGEEAQVWDVLSARNVFEAQAERLERYLQATNSRRVVFGHTPHRGRTPERYHGGRAINYDGALSRRHRKHSRDAPLSASVGPLEPIS